MSDVTLNGVEYHLDESGEGQHYLRSHQPLRPPNAQLIQGEGGKFQLRPDLLQWSWTDWSGGEGQIKFKQSSPERSYLIQYVNPFRRRGEIALGYKATLAQDSTGSSDFAVPGTLVKAYDSLFLVSSSTDDVYEWDGAKFGAAEDVTSASTTSPLNSATGDDEYLFRHSASGTNIHRRTAGGTWTKHNDQCGLTGEVILVELGSYVYVWEPTTGKVYEISKATANTADAEVEIANIPISPTIDADRFLMVAADNRIYMAVPINGNTSIQEIIPSSAAGTGYGNELALIEGVTAECIYYSGGTIFVIGYDKAPTGSVGPDRQVFYIDPIGTYGTLGSVRGYTKTNGPSALYPVPAGGRLAMSAFALPATWEDESGTNARMSLFEVDLVGGGFGAVASDGGHLAADQQATSLVHYKGRYFTSLTTKLVYWDIDTVDDAKVGYAVSAANDYGVGGQKILEQLEVVCDPLPASCDISIGYQLDGGSWTDTSLVSATSAVGGTLQVSTDSATKTFRSLKLRVKMTPSGGVGPLVKSVDAFARVNRRLRAWDLILDISDDTRGGFNGAKQLANLAGIAENTVVPFIDRYLTHDDEVAGTSLDVIVDSIQFNLSQPGEGQCLVRLIEVL